MELKDWLPFVGGIFGSVIGATAALVGVYMTQHRQRSLENENLLIARYELLHETLTEIYVRVGNWNAQMIGHLSHNRPYDFNDGKGRIPTEHLKMLAAFYAPFIEDDVTAIDEQLTIFGALMGESIARHPDEKRKGDIVVAGLLAVKAIEKSVAEAKAKLSRKVQALVPSDSLHG